MYEIIDTNEVMYKTLQTYLCDNVWNTPLLEYRRNITLRPVNNGLSNISSVSVGCGCQVSLPYTAADQTPKAFYVYTCFKSSLGGIIVDPTDDTTTTTLADDYNCGWIPLDKYLNIKPFELRVHCTHVEWLYRNEVFICNHPYLDAILIANEKIMSKQILGSSHDFKDMFLSVYYDSDNNLSALGDSSPMISCYYAEYGDLETLNTAYQYYSSMSEEEQGKTMCFIDGREATPMSLSDMDYNQYIEFVYDPDIICNIVLDMTDPDSNNIYRSSKDNTYKYIIHIPKAYNPNNITITHNTCDIYVRPINSAVVEDARLKGLFVHRFDTDNKDVDDLEKQNLITQLTHNDFAISEKLIQPYMDYIGSSECVIRVVVRSHAKAKTLCNSAEFLSILYTFDDASIIKFLIGDSGTDLTFWEATTLEDTEFSNMLFEVPTDITDANVTKYITALGYYNSLSIITPRVYRKINSPYTDNVFAVNVPISMYTCDNIGVSVYVNGLKLDQSYYTYKKVNVYIEVTVDTVIWETTAINDIVLELFDDPTFKAEYITISADNYKLDVTDNFDVYRVYDEAPLSDYYVDNYGQSSDKSYIKLTDDELENVVLDCTTTDTGATLTFSTTNIGKTYLVCSRNLYRAYDNGDILEKGGNVELSTITTDYGTTSDILHFGRLTINAITWDGEDTIELPIINPDWTPVIYLNQKELVSGIDYMFKPIYSTNGVSYCTVFINNISYLNNDNNSFEMLLTADHKFMDYHGFVKVLYETTTDTTNFLYGMIQDTDPFVYWFDNLCSMLVDGYNRVDMYKDDGVIKLTQYSANSDYNTRQGGLYKTRGLVPIESIDFVDQYWSNETDITRMALICEYLRTLEPIEVPNISLIQKSHHITSITMNALVKDVLSGVKRLNYDSSDEGMLKQIPEYLELEQYDAAMTGVAKELTLTNAGVSKINNTYTLSDSSMKDLNRVWKNTSNWITIMWNCTEDTKRWEIKDTSGLSSTVYYYAADVDGSHDPWNLTWVAVDTSYEPVPVVESGSLDLRFIDLFPSYSSDLQPVTTNVALKRAMEALYPTDSIKDGDTTI